MSTTPHMKQNYKYIFDLLKPNSSIFYSFIYIIYIKYIYLYDVRFEAWCNMYTYTYNQRLISTNIVKILIEISATVKATVWKFIFKILSCACGEISKFEIMKCVVELLFYSIIRLDIIGRLLCNHWEIRKITIHTHTLSQTRMLILNFTIKLNIY